MTALATVRRCHRSPQGAVASAAPAGHGRAFRAGGRATRRLYEKQRCLVLRSGLLESAHRKSASVGPASVACSLPQATRQLQPVSAPREAWIASSPVCAAVRQSRLQSSARSLLLRSSSSTTAETADEGAGKTALLGTLFAMWYAANIVFNIYNKQVLKVFTYPINCTELQFGVGSVIALSMWALNLHKRPKLDKDLIKSIAPLALVHMLGNLLTNVSLGKVAVSFTHTIKSLEPFFSVVLSAIFLGTKPEAKVVLSLLPIVAGVSLASFTEASFNWAGFGAAMGSNITFQSRNVLSKKLMGNQKEKLDNINLFSVITIMSFVFLMPIMLVTEGLKMTPAYISSIGLEPAVIIKKACIAGLMFHSYQQVSYMILQRVSPVTHSVGNCVKRVVVIVASVVAFRNPVSMVNGVGTAIALAGVFVYSQVKRLSAKK